MARKRVVSITHSLTYSSSQPHLRPLQAVGLVNLEFDTKNIFSIGKFIRALLD